MSTSQSILEYLKVLVWPALIITLVCKFEENIKGFIDRLRLFKIPNLIEAKAEEQAEAQVNLQKNDGEKHDLESDPGLVKLQSDYENQISSLKQGAEVIKNELVKANIELDFERIYNVIFGSQIELLQVLNSKLGIGQSKEYVNLYLVQQMIKFGSAFSNWNIDIYLSFLLRNGLLESDVSTGNYKITLKGQVFLGYITIRNYPLKGL